MLFKTLSASVYGIDAYLVEVEVDVGSARMTDFNVVGLPPVLASNGWGTSASKIGTYVGMIPSQRTGAYNAANYVMG